MADLKKLFSTTEDTEGTEKIDFCGLSLCSLCPLWSRSFKSLQNFFHTAHKTVFKADLDAMGVRRGLGQKILYDAFGPLS
jgi:hypothetical protein